jgi:hypothetical protein
MKEVCGLHVVRGSRVPDLAALAHRPGALLIAVAAASVALLVLSGVLSVVATAPRPHVLVPAATAPSVVAPDDVPDAAARSFALLYVLTFDNFTPATIAAATQALKARVAPRRFSEVADALDRRASVVVEGRMASQLAGADAVELARPGDGTIAVRVEGTRRLFIADKLSKESRVAYRLVLEPCPPTAANPNGLAVVAQAVEEADEARR